MLYIIRHGETELNSKHVIQGRSDHELNAKGLEQGRKAAECVADGIEIKTDDRLIEMDYGPYEGMSLTIGIDGENAMIKTGFGPFVKLDLGIVRYNFEVASGHKCRAI